MAALFSCCLWEVDGHAITGKSRVLFIIGYLATNHRTSMCVCLCVCAGPYLIVGVQRRQVGLLEGQNIYEVSKFDIIPFMSSTNHLSEAQVSGITWQELWHRRIFFPYM